MSEESLAILYGRQKFNKVTKGLCLFLGIDYVAAITEPGKSFADIVRADEPWKSRNECSIKKQKNAFKTVFIPEQRAYIEKSLIKPEFIRRSR